MTDSKSILIVSHACTRAVNRAPYVELMRLGWAVTIVTVATLDEACKVAEADAIDPDGPAVHFLPLVGRNARLQRYADLVGLIKRIRPDWVIADIDPHSLLAVELAARKTRLGYRLGFISCENLPFGPRELWHRRGTRGVLLAAFCTAVRQWVRPRADLVFTINTAGERLFREAGFERVVRTPLGFPETNFRMDDAARSKIRRHLGLTGPVVAYFGRLAPEKGVHILLDALDQLEDLEWRLLLDDFQSESIYQMQIRKRVATASWAKRVNFIHASHGAVANYMNAADIVVVPSVTTPNWVEQYGRVLPEALACGCRVIASDVGALPELMGGEGTLVPEADVVALAGAIRNSVSECRINDTRRASAAEYALHALSASAQARCWNQELGRK
jgi:glycosyltransferase involved in cell wall biosynthesis